MIKSIFLPDGTELRPIPNLTDYYASKYGYVYSMKPSRNNAPKPAQPRLKTKVLCVHGKDKRYVILICENGKKFNMPLSWCVLMAWVSPRPEGMCALHGKNGSLDDSLENLSWGTMKQNQLDRFRDGTDCSGSKFYKPKLNDLQVRIIRHAYSNRGRDGLTSIELSEVFGVSIATICYIAKGQRWKTVPPTKIVSLLEEQKK